VSEPNFAIVGAQKSASTFLHECLAQHPEVFLAPGELPGLESPDYEAGGWETLRRAFAGRTERQRGFRRPNLLGTEVAAERIARHLPEARLIAVLRAPIARAVSAYHHYASDGFIPVLPVEEGLGRLLDDPLALGPRAHEIFEFGFYARHLARFDTYARAGRLLVMLHDDLVADPQASLARALEFLGVDPVFTPRWPGRPQAVAYRPARIRFRRLPNRIAFRYDPDGRRRRPRQGPARWLVKAVTALDRALLAPLLGDAPPALPSHLHARLAALYRDDVQLLAERLGRDLTHWLARTEDVS